MPFRDLPGGGGIFSPVGFVSAGTFKMSEFWKTFFLVQVMLQKCRSLIKNFSLLVIDHLYNSIYILHSININNMWNIDSPISWSVASTFGFLLPAALVDLLPPLAWVLSTFANFLLGDKPGLGQVDSSPRRPFGRFPVSMKLQITVVLQSRTEYNYKIRIITCLGRLWFRGPLMDRSSTISS